MNLPTASTQESDRMHCYLCAGTKFTPRPGVVRDAPALQIIECNSCGLVSLSSFDHISVGHYEDAGMYGESVPDVDSMLRDTDWDDERRFQFLKSAMTGKRVLDFGCGAGGFLLKARSVAAEVEGMELERRLQAHFKSANLNVHGRLEDVAPQSFDLVTAFHVVEHLPDPRKTLQQLGPLLTANGTLIVEVPSADDALLTLYKSDAFSRFSYWSQHLFLFTQRTLAELVAQSGLRLVWLKQVQRYPLSNHLHWLANGKPGGHVNWSFLDSRELHTQYEAQLAALGRCDTLVAGIARG